MHLLPCTRVCGSLNGDIMWCNFVCIDGVKGLFGIYEFPLVFATQKHSHMRQDYQKDQCLSHPSLTSQYCECLIRKGLVATDHIADNVEARCGLGMRNESTGSELHLGKQSCRRTRHIIFPGLKRGSTTIDLALRDRPRGIDRWPRPL
jgi:hypothetical protein